MSVRKRQWQAANGEIQDCVGVRLLRPARQAPKRDLSRLRSRRSSRAGAGPAGHLGRASTSRSTPRQTVDGHRAAMAQASPEVDGRERATLAGYRQHVELHILGQRRDGSDEGCEADAGDDRNLSQSFAR